jgi:hypothetical protein
MSWGDFDAVVSWRGVDGIITQLSTLGTYGAYIFRVELSTDRRRRTHLVHATLKIQMQMMREHTITHPITCTHACVLILTVRPVLVQSGSVCVLVRARVCVCSGSDGGKARRAA